MKKFITSAACMMTLLVAGMGFASCSSTDEEVNNPNYNPVDGTVNTNFVFNVATANTPQSRQTSANTQATSNDGFRGISDARLLSFLQGSPLEDGKYLTTVSTTPTATSANKHYNLGHVMTTSDATTDQSKSHRIIELSLPTQTNTLMFYGKAPKSGENADFAQGKISYLPRVTNSNATDLTQYDFALTRIVDDAGAAKFQQYGNLIAAALNYIMNAGLNGVDVNYESHNYSTTVSWMNYVTISDAGAITPATKDPTESNEPMCAIGEMLADELATLATIITPGEVRAGSGPAVSRTLGDLLVVLNKINVTTPATLADARAQAVADDIRTRILACFNGTAPTLTWKAAADVKTATGYTGDITNVVPIGSTSALDEFPKEAFNLPPGCAQLTVATTKSTDTNGKVTSPGSVTWSYLTSVSTFNKASTTTFNNVYYPAEICYFGNSPIRVTNEAVIESEYPQGVANWDTDGNWASKNWTKNSHVVSTTRSVAMQYNINYGTALLKSTVKYDANATVLYDNNHNIQKAKKGGILADTEEPNKEINFDGNTFTLTGVLVGGAPTTVGWDFLPVSGTTYGQCIYDKAVASGVIPATGESQANYTLVWDNWNDAQKGNKQNDVYVCLEFQNNSGQDFWGEHNIIRNGGTFYIIGKLDPDAGRSTTDRSAGVTWPADTHPQALPPFKTGGTTLKERRVFIQDFMTTANFVIGATSLQHAYVTVPDLRSTQISLGLSVDLKWETGLVFDDIVLGQ